MIVGKRVDGSIFQVSGGDIEQEVEMVKDQKEARESLVEIGIQSQGPILVSIKGGLLAA